MLFSLTGPQAQMEQSILDGALLAVDEINNDGGIRGQELLAAIYDDHSEVLSSARGINHLCQNEDVSVIVGGYTSASRIAMLPAVHANRALLMYPTYFEGEETDSRVFYCGAAPNQYLADYLRWVADNLGRKVYTIGSDYVYPRVLAEAIARHGVHLDMETVGTWYAPLGETNFQSALDDIGRKQPSVVMCNLVGLDSTTEFYAQFNRAGFDASTLPIAATVTTEVDVAHMPAALTDGHYMVGSYFSGIDSEVNISYRQSLLEVRDQRWAHPAQVGAYNAVHAVRIAAEHADSTESAHLSAALLGVRFDRNPEGLPFHFLNDHYSAHPSYVARARNGRYDVIDEFSPRLPEPWWSGSRPLATPR
ncbi:transporter substrate-binding protein [Williamsia sp.]|uniref:transporter substrate-binding protein n=1 Tax=Williamsia sp. TaxID=1872085 RepID=UPI002F920C4E